MNRRSQVVKSKESKVKSFRVVDVIFVLEDLMNSEDLYDTLVDLFLTAGEQNAEPAAQHALDMYYNEEK